MNKFTVNPKNLKDEEVARWLTLEVTPFSVITSRMKDRAFAIMAANGLAYHNLNHIKGMLSALDFVWPHHPHKAEIELAVLYHDIVYVPGDTEGHSEMLSSMFFKATLNRFLKEYEAVALPSELKEVPLWIQCTRVHHHLIEGPELASTKPETILLDLDLMSLAAPYEEFKTNQNNIVEEHGVPLTSEVRVKQKEFLRQFLNKMNIYRTEAGRALWEDRARKNIATFIGD